jgi:hypothetical protein
MSFLDTTTTVKEGNMTTDLYSKPTDKHQYLSPSSCLPKHCFTSIPFSQAIRVKRICSTVETTEQRLGDLRHHLKRQGYNDKVIESGFSKASEINRNDLLEYKENKINKRVPLVLTYHPSLEKISGIVRHHWKEIEKSEMLAKLFPEPPVVVFRRPNSINDTLVRAAANVNHVVTSVTSADSNCNTHKFSIARRQERSIRSFAMSIAKHLMWFTSLTVTSAGRNT